MKKQKTKKRKTAKGCQCSPAPKPLLPVSGHSAVCPISRRYTVNGKVIADMMHSEKMRGNYKDHVILSGSSLLDYNGTFEMRLQPIDSVTGLPIDKEKKLSVPSVCIVHKRKLHNFIGDEQAALFWKPGFGRISHG